MTVDALGLRSGEAFTQDWYCVECAKAGKVEGRHGEGAYGVIDAIRDAHAEANKDRYDRCEADPRVGATYTFRAGVRVDLR